MFWEKQFWKFDGEPILNLIINLQNLYKKYFKKITQQ